MSKKSKEIQNVIAEMDLRIENVSKAQKAYSTFSQEQVDEIFRAAAIAANDARIPLARMAVEETRMGVLEDKVIKNHFASEIIFNKYKNAKTCGVIEEDNSYGIKKIVEPIGVICAIIPTTNPTSTAIFKTLIALKTRNAVVVSPHPRALNCTIAAVKTIMEAAEKAGAPKGLFAWVDSPSVEVSNHVMTHPKINMILATGGPGMVKAAYSSGNPAVGVGAGNTPALIDESADINTAVSSILMSKTFDNGVICASEQSIVVHRNVYEQVKKELVYRGAYILNKAERKKVGALIIDPERGSINPDIVGQKAVDIAAMAEIKLPMETKVLVGEVTDISPKEPFAHEKLSPCLAMYKCDDFTDGLEKARRLVEQGGIGHTSVIYTDAGNDERIRRFGDVMKTGRILVNIPSSQGAIGDLYNFRLEPSLTLGCGSWGGNAVSENVGIKHLLNIKSVAERRENMLWFKIPQKIYHKYGCLPMALKDLEGKKRAFIVTDSYLYDSGVVDKVAAVLKPLGIDVQTFHQISPDPDLSTINAGLNVINDFKPDVIIGLGGGSPMDAAKIMWLLYEHPEVKFEGLALRFMDIMKRIYAFPNMGKKAQMVAIPTTSGTGSEVTPFAVVTDDRTGMKYPIADYALTPNMAIIDTELVMSMPKSLTAASGIDAVTHAIEAFVSVMSTDYTNALALESLRLLFKYLPEAYREGSSNIKARQKVHNAATMAGMAFANAFLGICHSMAHKMGAAFHVPHGIANAILIPHVIRFNATDNPSKQAAFAQYKYPTAIARYARIADQLNLGGETNDEKVNLLCDHVYGLMDACEVPHTFQTLGIDEKQFLEQLDVLAETAFDDQCTGSNPRYPLIAEIKEMYRLAYYGK